MIDAVGIVLAAMGMLNPMLAAFIHVGSELAFILNSARLLALQDLAPQRKAAPQTTAALEPAAKDA